MTPQTETPPPPGPNDGYSLFLFALAVLGFIAAIGLAISSAPLFLREVESGGLAFLVGAFGLGLLTLLLVVLPNSLLLRKTGDRRARLSLRLAWLTLAVVSLNVAAVILFGR